MLKTIDREALYAMVWTEPVRTVAERFGVSDVALKKACQKALIPTPDRGYWAKLAAGKPVVKAALALRQPGFSPEVTFGNGGGWCRHWTREELLGEIPPPPHFDESLESVRARIEATLGKVKCPTKGGIWHTSIQRLLSQDEDRRRKAADSIFSWDQPLFTSPVEQRRLRILNSVFLAVGRFGGKVTVRGREARDLSITFDKQHVVISLEEVKPRGKAPAVSNQSGLSFAILKSFGSTETRSTWTDHDQERLEQQLTTIAAEVVLTAEAQLREGAVHLHQWRIERKAALEEEDVRQRAERERLERERLERLEQARIDGLLKAAYEFRSAQEIRAYVEGLGARLEPTDEDRWYRYQAWSVWALAQADRIDPALNASFDLPSEAEPATS